MKRIAFLLLMFIILFSGCSKITRNENEGMGMNINTEFESTLEISKNTSILLSVNSVNSNCLELEICNKTSNTIFWGQWFAIEKKESNAWYQLQEIELEENAVFGWEDVLYFLKEGGMTTENENWSDYYGSLSKGDYRIIKAFYFDERKQDEKVYVACEFSIE